MPFAVTVLKGGAECGCITSLPRGLRKDNNIGQSLLRLQQDKTAGCSYSGLKEVLGKYKPHPSARQPTGRRWQSFIYLFQGRAAPLHTFRFGKALICTEKVTETPP